MVIEEILRLESIYINKYNKGPTRIIISKTRLAVYKREKDISPGEKIDYIHGMKVVIDEQAKDKIRVL